MNFLKKYFFQERNIDTEIKKTDEYLEGLKTVIQNNCNHYDINGCGNPLYPHPICTCENNKELLEKYRKIRKLRDSLYIEKLKNYE